MNTFVNYCTDHLYFIEKTKEGYMATCLFCKAERFYIKKGEIEESSILQGCNFLSREDIKKKHHVDISYQNAYNVIEQWIVENPNLSSKDIVTKFMIYLHEIDLAAYHVMLKRSSNAIRKIYLQKKCDNTFQMIETLTLQLDKPKQKIKQL